MFIIINNNFKLRKIVARLQQIIGFKKKNLSYVGVNIRKELN